MKLQDISMVWAGGVMRRWQRKVQATRLQEAPLAIAIKQLDVEAVKRLLPSTDVTQPIAVRVFDDNTSLLMRKTPRHIAGEACHRDDDDRQKEAIARSILALIEDREKQQEAEEKAKNSKAQKKSSGCSIM